MTPVRHLVITLRDRAVRSSAYPDRVVTTPRTYEVRTFGCQMNVHDSERISGLTFVLFHSSGI
jgi:hypothetical protein